MFKAGMSIEDREAFQKELYYTNINRAKIYTLALIAAHLVLIIFDIRRLVSGIFKTVPGYRYLYYAHIVLTAGLIVFLVLFYLLKADLPEEIRPVHKVLFLAFIAFLLFIAAGISSIDQLIHGEITVYIIGILAISVGAYIPLLPRFLLFVPAQVILLLGVFYLQKDGDILVSHFINSILVFIISVTLSQIMFLNKRKTFLSGKVIKRQQEKLERLSLEDSLTGLRNRRYIDAKVIEEWDRALRYDRELSVAFADLDHFKHINDSYGHQFGDEVLREVGVILRGSIRGTDVVARFGGEEFLLLLPETPKEQAAAICEKVRSQIESYPWESSREKLSMTVSLGLAGRREVDSVEELIKLADERLYRAKEAGRNTICCWE